MAPYTHDAETVQAVVQANKTRIERIHIRTPSNENGVADTANYSVVMEIAKFDANGKKVGTELAKTSGLAEVVALIAKLPLSGKETLGDQIKRHGYAFVVGKGKAPAGGSVS